MKTVCKTDSDHTEPRKKKSITGRLAPFDWFLIIGVTASTIAYSIYQLTVNKVPFDYLGLIAAITGVLCVVMVSKGMIINYIFGLINVSLYAYISYKSELYGDFALNLLYYVPMQFFGWFSWKKHRKADANKESQQAMKTTVQARRMTTSQRIILALSSITLVIAAGYILDRFTSDPYPYKDAATTILSIIAMFIMIKAYMEQWFLWMATNLISIVIWTMLLIKGDYSAGMMTVMWIFYLINSINGFIIWKKESKKLIIT